MDISSMRRSANDRGFTLIELLVVMIIIGILAAIAIPVYLNQLQEARQTNAKSIVLANYPTAKVGKLHSSADYHYAATVDFGSVTTECGFDLREDTMKCDGEIPAPTKRPVTPGGGGSVTPSAEPTVSPTGTLGGPEAPATATATVTVTQTVTASPAN